MLATYQRSHWASGSVNMASQRSQNAAAMKLQHGNAEPKMKQGSNWGGLLEGLLIFITFLVALFGYRLQTGSIWRLTRINDRSRSYLHPRTWTANPLGHWILNQSISSRLYLAKTFGSICPSLPINGGRETNSRWRWYLVRNVEVLL